MPVVIPSAQSHSNVRGVSPQAPAPAAVTHAEPTRERQTKANDDRPTAVTLEPHWAATIDAATD